MRHYLLSKGLWKYVDGTEVLAEGATDAAQRTFRDNSQKALSTIVMAISTPQLYLVTSCESPRDVWDTLLSHFERGTLANKLFLKKKYFRKEMKEDTSMEAHLKEMKELTDKLASIGAAISEEDQVVTLLGSLPPTYSTIVTALEARVDDVSLDFVQQALVHEEQNRRMPWSLIPHLTLLSIVKEDTDPEDNRYAGIAKRSVTFVVFVQRIDPLTNPTRPLRPSNVLRKMSINTHSLCLEPHLIERSGS